MKLKNIQTGKTFEERVRAGSDIEFVRVDKTPMQFLYREGDSYHFMDNQTFEQIEIAGEAIGEPAQFLKDSDMCDVLFYDDNQIMGVDVPMFATLQVTESSVALRGDTATNVNKLVTVETGAQVQVPAFINEGDLIKVDTRSGAYMERVSK